MEVKSEIPVDVLFQSSEGAIVRGHQRTMNYLKRTRLSCSRMIQLPASPPPASPQQVAAKKLVLYKSLSTFWGSLVFFPDGTEECGYLSLNLICHVHCTQCTVPICYDRYPVLYFGMFSRDVDDKIIYALNLSTPTASIQARGANSTGKRKQLFRFYFSYVFRFVLSVVDS